MLGKFAGWLMHLPALLNCVSIFQNFVGVPRWCPSHYRIICSRWLGFQYVRNVHHTQCRQFYILAFILGPICWAVCSLCKLSPILKDGGVQSMVFWAILNLLSSRVFFAIANASLFLGFNILESGSPRRCMGWVSWVLMVDVKVDLGPCHIPKRMVFLQ